jgi:phosphoglycolate phosphatase
MHDVAELEVVGDSEFIAGLSAVDATRTVDPVADTDPEAVVYDLDGTLVRLLVDWQRLEADLADRLASHGVDDPGGDVWSRYEAGAEAGFGDELDGLIAERERAGARASVRLPAANVVGTEGVPVGVCSLNSEAACRLALDAQGLSDHVEVVVGRDTVEAMKPDPAPLLAACEALGVDPERTLFVGDSESDAECAERAGTLFRYVDGEPARAR